MEDRRVISAKQGQSFADAHGLRYLETSAKTSENVETVFISLA
jgi:hypothetical protein